MNDITKLIKQVDELEYRVDNLAKQNVDVLRKTIDTFSGDKTETFTCVIRRGKLDIEVFTAGLIGNIAVSFDGEVVSTSNGGFLVAHAYGVSLGQHTVSIAISATGSCSGAMIVCYGAI